MLTPAGLTRRSAACTGPAAGLAALSGFQGKRQAPAVELWEFGAVRTSPEDSIKRVLARFRAF